MNIFSLNGLTDLDKFSINGCGDAEWDPECDTGYDCIGNVLQGERNVQSPAKLMGAGDLQQS